MKLPFKGKPKPKTPPKDKLPKQTKGYGSGGF
jgi:hypothetical protein